MIDLKLREEALTIWDSARATLESGDVSDLARLQIESAFELYEDRIASLTRELEEAKEALKPFAEMWRVEQEASRLTRDEARQIDSYEWFRLRGLDGETLASITSGDLRAAATLLSTATSETA